MLKHILHTFDIHSRNRIFYIYQMLRYIIPGYEIVLRNTLNSCGAIYDLNSEDQCLLCSLYCPINLDGGQQIN